MLLSFLLFVSKLSRERKHLEEKLNETQTSLEQEENKLKQEHRQRLKLEQLIAELEEKLEREIKVHCLVLIIRGIYSLCMCSVPAAMDIVVCVLRSLELMFSFITFSHQRRQELERDKRKLQQEIAELQEKLSRAKQRIEDLEGQVHRLEAELNSVTNRC